MKKLYLAILAISMLFICGCGNGWELWKKDFKSDYAGGLEREYNIYTINGQLIKTISGTSYWTHSNGTVVMDVTIYNVKTNKKIDMVGNFIVIGEEK